MTAARAKKGARGADEVKPDTAGLPPVPAGLPRIAVAFGGGGARGLAHIHVIRELDALGIRPVAISGSSIGAIMGSAMAAGMTGDAIFDHARSVLSDKAEAASRLWRSRPASFSEMMSKGIRFSQFNIENILNVFAQTGTTSNARYAQTLATQDSANFAVLAKANGVYDDATGSISLPGSDAECGGWLTTGANPSPPTCYFLRKDEQRFGNGDGVYTLAEQRTASDVARLGTFNISRFAGAGRTLRFGMEVNF